jgi:hypothetical protein
MITPEAEPMRIVRALSGVVALVAVLSAPVLAQGINVTGKWTFDVQTGQGTGQPTLTFKQDGEKLTGHYSSQTLGEADFTGTIKGNAVRIAFNVNAQGTDIDVVYDGTVDAAGTSMKGSVNMAGGQLSGSFTGKKQ